MFTEHDLEQVRKEAEYAAQKWGTDFDDQNSLNDWVTYITMYASDAARIDLQDNPDKQYAFLIKAAGLALNAASYVRNGNLHPRHYDADRSFIPSPTAHGEGNVPQIN